MTFDSQALDERFIAFARRVFLPWARVSLFIVFFWFGILKIFGNSPANPMVADLQARTLPWLTFDTFIIAFAGFEMAIGLAFLIPRWERAALLLLAIHMGTTFLPLLFLPAMTWQAPFVPTMEGQYIIKNIIIIGLALGVASRLRPLGRKQIPSVG